ncbi:MAG: cytochrome, partial [bacterium]
LLGDQAAAGPGGSKLTAEQKEGRQLFAEKCATCHTLKDAGAVGKVGPNLDMLAPAPALTTNAIENGRANGKGQMPAQLLEKDEAKKVASYIAAVADR